MPDVAKLALSKRLFDSVVTELALLRFFTPPRIASVGRSAMSRGAVAGFSLVEVLVAVLVLAVGMLGLAALQIAGLRSNESAQARTRASLAVYDAVDRLRANPAAFFSSSDGSYTVKSSVCAKASATGRESLDGWIDALCALGLTPPADGDLAIVNCKSTACGAGNCEIAVSWDDSRAEQGSSRAASLHFSVCTRLPSVP